MKNRLIAVLFKGRSTDKAETSVNSREQPNALIEPNLTSIFRVPGEQ